MSASPSLCSESLEELDRSGTSDEHAVQAAIKQKVVNFMSTKQVAREILRCTEAHQAFFSCGSALRPNAEYYDLTMVICCVAAVGASTACPAIRVFGAYYRAVEDMEKTLRTLRIMDTSCSCCASGHVGQSFCDKELICACITEWFGSTEAFEHYIQTDVTDVLVHQLQWGTFRYKWSCAVAAPALWACLDIASFPYQREDLKTTFVWLGAGLTLTFMAIPGLSSWCKFLTYTFRHGASCRHEVMRTSLVIICALPLLAYVVGAVLLWPVVRYDAPAYVQLPFFPSLMLPFVLLQCRVPRAPDFQLNRARSVLPTETVSPVPADETETVSPEPAGEEVPSQDIGCVAMPLMRCLRQATLEAGVSMLSAITPLVEARPELFRAMIREFFVQSFDPPEMKRLKLKVVEILVDETNVQLVLRELQVYVSWHSQPLFVAQAVRSIAQVALKISSVPPPAPLPGRPPRSRGPGRAAMGEIRETPCAMRSLEPAFSAALRRLPGGCFAKMPRSQAMTALPPQTTLNNMCTYFHQWPKHKSMFIIYGARHASSTAGTYMAGRIQGDAEINGASGLETSIYGGSHSAAGAVNGAEGKTGRNKVQAAVRPLGLGGLKRRFQRGEKLSMVTAYDFPSGRFARQAGVELVLVGDSLGNCRLGLADTVGVTMEEICFAPPRPCAAAWTLWAPPPRPSRWWLGICHLAPSSHKKMRFGMLQHFVLQARTW
ncbi:unnamed protein product [Effrenium voratum]|uniref:3-methyl-2-oxobutanoate hydroxymethyltransferase n=1 Tax=Effrenium voratum TaxID=2562239 RepID=A0AA36IL21_9DINO|nr:unnamed protein product [Effrenium voratum]